MPISYTRDDWVKVGFGDGMAATPTSPNDPMRCDLRTDVTTWDTPFQEAINAANHILDNAELPVNVLLSGGVDSQAMVEAFLATNRQDFRIICFEFENGLNDYDVVWAKKHAETFGYELIIRPFEIVDFHESRLFDLAAEVGLHSPHILSHIAMIDTLDGTCVLAGNPIGRRNETDYVDVPNYSLIGTKLYRRKPVVGQFFLYSPELAYSFLSQQTDKHSSYDDKLERYRMAGFNLILPPTKYHGFEALKELYDTEDHRVTRRLRRFYTAKYYSNRIYDHLFRHPLMEKYPYSEVVVPMITDHR